MTAVRPGATLAELAADPYAVYARLRREEPVCWMPELRRWLVTRWAEVSRILDDPDLFASVEQHHIRATAMHGHDPHRVMDRVEATVRPCARRWADNLAAAGRAELTGAYFEPVALAHTTLKQFAQGQLMAGWLGASTLSALLEHPDQLRRVRADRRLIGPAVDETLRWNSIIGTVARRGTRVACVGGRELPEGTTFALCLGSAGRDDTVFDDPDAFDVHRTVRTHLAFGAGTHHCPAFAFVPAVARTALEALLDRLPDLAPAPGWRPAPQGWKIRHPGPVNVVWATG